MLMKHGSEGGFLATPAFVTNKAGSDLSSRLIHLDRHGEQQPYWYFSGYYVSLYRDMPAVCMMLC